MQGHNFQAPINIATLELPNSSSFFDVEGAFKMVVEKAELKQTKTNAANVMLALTLKIIEGEHTGKRGVHNLNIYNQNPDAVKIAFGELAAYATAMGADPMLQNTAQLCGKPFFVYVSVVQKADKLDPNKMYTNNNFSDWAYADGTPIVLGQFGATGGKDSDGQQYAPRAPVAVAPVAVAPAQAGYAPQAQQQPQAPVAAAQPQYTPQAQQAPVAQQPQYAPQAAQQPAFVPPAGAAAPFVPQG